jgi:hypothetical protein
MSIQAKFLHLQAIHNLLAPYRYLYCVDLEATCDEVGLHESPRSLVVVPDQMETIEIGLVVIDLETLEIVDEFQRFVQPQINPTLTDFCKQLTSIQQSNVDGAELRLRCATWGQAWAQSSGPLATSHHNLTQQNGCLPSACCWDAWRYSRCWYSSRRYFGGIRPING